MSELDEAVERERRRWPDDASEAAAWDARALVDRLRKGDDPQRAVEFGAAALEQWPGFEPLRSALAWALYSRDVAPLDDDNANAAQRQVAKDATAEILELVGHDPYSKFSAWPAAVLRLARVAQARWPAAALEWLHQLDPNRLSTEPSGDYASFAGRWHLGVTKALEELERWEELLAACDRALESGTLRSEDTKWVRRRRALALEHLDRADEAVPVLTELRHEIRDWWIDADLARVLAAAGKREEAIEVGRRTLASPGDLTWRWRTAFLLAQLVESEDEALASQHYELARYLRGRGGWPPDRDLETASRRLGLPAEPPAQLDLAPLRNSWRDARDPERAAGIVKVVLGEGHSGFIVPDGGEEDLYFAHRNRDGSVPPPGTRVTFRVVESFDKKKNRPSKRAVDVRPE